MKAVFSLCVAGCVLSGMMIPVDGSEDEARIRAEFDRQVDLFIRTTESDLKSEKSREFPNPSVNLLSAEMVKSKSLVIPYTGKVEYLIEYDNLSDKTMRMTHPYLLRCKYVESRWNIDPHANRLHKNVEDLEPKKSRMLYPNL